MDGADCCLICIVLGVKPQYYPICVNIAQYSITQYQYRSNPRNICSTVKISCGRLVLIAKIPKHLKVRGDTEENLKLQITLNRT